METGDKKLNIDKAHYEKAVCPCCGEDIFVKYQSAPKTRILGLVNSNGVMTNARGNPDVETIYNFWNGQHIVVHKKMTSDIAKTIKSALKDYTETEIMQAIKNYAEIQNGKQYWFKYAWTLRDFLKRGLPKFTDLKIARSNYLKHDIVSTTKPQYKKCERCGYKAQTDAVYCPKCDTKLEKDFTAGKYGHLVRS